MIPNVHDPTAVVKEVAGKLKAKAEGAGLKKLDDFLAQLDTVHSVAKEGPGDVMVKLMSMLEDLQSSLLSALKDPSELAGGTPLATCGPWYGESVVSNLDEVRDEVQVIAVSARTQSTELASAFGDLGNSIAISLEGITSTVRNLTALPDEVSKLADEVKEPSDLKEVDTGPMEEACNISAIDGPLSDLDDSKKKLVPSIESLNRFISELSVFLESSPDKIQNAFDIPKPLCFLQPIVMSEAPSEMTNLLQKLVLVKGLNLDSTIKHITTLSEKLVCLDISSVKDLLTTFAADAKEDVDALSKAVEVAKTLDNVSVSKALEGAKALDRVVPRSTNVSGKISKFF